MNVRSVPGTISRIVWLAGFLIGWGIVRSLVLTAAYWLLDNTPFHFVLVVSAEALTTVAVAWALAYFALRLGAPGAIWISVTVASLPFALLAGIGLYTGSDLSWVVAAIVQVIGPPLVMFLEARRQLPHQVSPAAHSLPDPASSSGT